MSVTLSIRNRQRERPVNTRQLRRITRCLLEKHLQQERFDLSIQLVGAAEMTRFNETFLRHAGSTDVITFDYGPGALDDSVGCANAEMRTLHGELLICLDEAVIQARRFRATWPSELVRYVIHGVLHLLGYDDQRANDRHKMKREENRLLRQLERSFAFAELAD